MAQVAKTPDRTTMPDSDVMLPLKLCLYVQSGYVCVSEGRLFCVPVSKIFSCTTRSKQDQLALSMTGCHWRSGNVVDRVEPHDDVAQSAE